MRGAIYLRDDFSNLQMFAMEKIFGKIFSNSKTENYI